MWTLNCAAEQCHTNLAVISMYSVTIERFVRVKNLAKSSKVLHSVTPVISNLRQRCVYQNASTQRHLCTGGVGLLSKGLIEQRNTIEKPSSCSMIPIKNNVTPFDDSWSSK